ncbi:GGDEF domain-containing protein [Devosia sp. XK-2]|uniref:GGDEF domain-containing protein n=1 Tax=Devosia sp. XK-2 TaxID=3126689 RepID=UPI0030CE6B63
MARIDVFSFGVAVPALLLAAGFLVAYAINRRLTTFRWWAASFALLAIALTTATLRFEGPSHWIKCLSWATFYAAACITALGLFREGATRTNPTLPILAGGALYVALATALIATAAPPHWWFLLGPVPTLVFMAWSIVPVLQARAWPYGLALGAGMAVIAIRALWFANDLMRMGPPPHIGLRGTLAAGAPLPARIPLGPGRGPGPVPGADTLLNFRPPPGDHPPVGEPLTIALITIAALLGLAVALVLRDLLVRISHMHERSTTDAMTGLLNRATFEEKAHELLASALHQPVCAVLLDIDHFKRINDTCGHLAGDKVIARLGELIADNTGPTALAGRIGGEEFAILLKGHNLSAARLYAEAIRTRFSASDLGDEIGWVVTLSAGIAARDGNESLAALMSRADKALYAAKARGRNQVAVAADTAERQLRRSLAAAG